MIPFRDWTSVLVHVRKGLPIYYRAPMDTRARRIDASVSGPRARKVRVRPWSGRDFDPFMADSGHLERFGQSIMERTHNSATALGHE